MHIWIGDKSNKILIRQRFINWVCTKVVESFKCYYLFIGCYKATFRMEIWQNTCGKAFAYTHKFEYLLIKSYKMMGWVCT